MQRRKTGKISIFNSFDVIFDCLMSWVKNLNRILTWDWYQVKSECLTQVIEIDIKLNQNVWLK